jgi:hypothetical protein
MDVLSVILGKNFQLPKLIGAFLVFGAVLMLFLGVAQMFNVWDSLKSYPVCAGEALDPSNADLVLAHQQYSDCKEILYRTTGIQLLYKQVDLTQRQYWGALISPIIGIFLWAIVFFLGIMLYNTGKIFIPVQSNFHEPQKKKKGAK